MNKKRFNIISSIVLITILVTSLGAGIGIGFAKKQKPDFVKFHFNGGSKSGKWDTAQSTDSANATEIENAFMRGLLFNQYYDDGRWKDDGNWNSALKSNDNWNIPYILTKTINGSINESINELKKDFIQTKLLSQTTSQSVYDYLANDKDLNNNSSIRKIEQELLALIETNPKATKYNFFEFKINLGEIFQKLISALGLSNKFMGSILTDMMVYGYLWQKSASPLYDYNLTKEIAYDKPSIVSSAAIDAYNAFKKEGTIMTESESWKTLSRIGSTTHPNIKVTANEWNAILNKLNKQNALKDSTILNKKFNKDSFSGFDGIKMGIPGDNTKEDWLNIGNTWTLGTSGNYETKEGSYSNSDVLTNSNYYVAKNEDSTSKTAKGIGAIITKTTLNEARPPEKGTDANIYNYSQLYPFAFSKKIDANTSSSIKYSLFGKSLGNNTWEPSTSSKAKERNVHYIMNKWFGDEMQDLGEIYLAEQIIQYHNDDLIAKARQFWHDKGFYIELSGKYDSKFGTLIPSDLLK